MKKWEYLIIKAIQSVDGFITDVDIIKVHKLGKAGWEMVGAFPGRHWIFIFKRIEAL